ncbi:hypothetical protein [Halosimplex sp. TS25]|uniref:hypothetical protein n=1 Tax=Halosimplex rarum TaxID=3396619 RepID=UPI0039E7F0DD
MSSTTLQALKIQQKPGAPTMYSTVVDAAETLEWADVPRKKDDFMAGYQRDLNERYDDIKDYLTTADQNIIPGAVLIGVDEDAVSIDEDGDVVTLTIEHNQHESDELIQAQYEAFYERLSDEEQRFVDGEISNDPADHENGSLPASHLAELTKELKQASEDWDSLSDDRQEAVSDYVEGLAVPGNIIDGQHRLWGAKEVTKFDVDFPAVIIPGLTDPEEVFQFYVLNSTASPLSRDQLHAVISTSLSNGELEVLFKRFKQTGVHAREAKLSYRLHRRDDSPFQHMVDFGLPNSQGIIKESISFNLVKSFVKPNTSYKRLYDGVDDWEQDPDYDYRLKVFLTFWNAVTDEYSDAWNTAREPDATDVERQITQKIALDTLQEFLLDRLKLLSTPVMGGRSADTMFADLDAVDEGVRMVLADLPEEFFTREWTESSLNTHQGREFFREQMEKASNDRQIGSMKLFKQTK